MATAAPAPAARNSRGVGNDPPLVRWSLTLLALAAMAVFIVLPLFAVFVQAFQKGVAAYLTAIEDPNTLSAIKLSLLTAGIALSVAAAAQAALQNGPSVNPASGDPPGA